MGNTYGASTALFIRKSVVPGWKIGMPCMPPVIGVRLTVPTAVTPGTLRTASIIAFRFSIVSASPRSARGRSISTNIAPCGWMPIGACSARARPRTATSEAVINNVQMAICTPSNRSRRANRPRWVDSDGPFFKLCKGLLCHACRAGTMPNSSALARVKTRPARYTRASTLTARGPANGYKRFSAPSSSSAPSRPAAPPISDSIAASVNSCRTSRRRLEPRATRSASSLLRSAARAANRLARLAQAAASTSSASTVTLHRKSRMTSPASPISPGWISRSDCPSSVSGYSFASSAAIAFRSSVACCGVTPGLSRPITVTAMAVRLCR